MIILIGVIVTIVLDFIFPMNDVKLVPNIKNPYDVGIMYYPIIRSGVSIVAKVFYPTNVHEVKLTPYYPHSEVIPVHIQSYQWPRIITLYIQELKLHISPGAIVKDKGPFPLVIFSHGINGIPDNYVFY